VIEELVIRGLGVIDEAVLPLAPGFTALTGETGAGKTMVVTGLGLLLGARGDAAAVRPAAPRLHVSGTLRPDAGAAVLDVVADLGGEVEDGTLLLARSVGADGRSRAWVGGQPVPVSALAEVGALLVAVHGQADQRRLLSPAWQRAALDRFAAQADPQHAVTLASYQDEYARWRELAGTLADLRARGADVAVRRRELQDGLAAVAAVAPLPAEDAALAAEQNRLGHAAELAEAVAAAHAVLVGDPAGEPGSDAADAAGLVGDARRQVERAAALDPQLGSVLDRLGEAAALVADAAAELASYADAVEADPGRLAWLGERRSTLHELERRFGLDLDAVLAWVPAAQAELEELDDSPQRVTALTEQVARARERARSLAGALTAVRRAAGERLAAAVTAELAALAMPQAVLHVAVTERGGADPSPDPSEGDGSRLGPDGADEVALLLEGHAGAPPRPLGRGASGGELSRVMLGLEVVLAGADPVPTFVFDEVDAGVGGRAAVEVGRRLARLARDAQVLVVTHLPQVAAFADRHLVVERDASGAVVHSGVRLLDDEGRVAETTRMMAGLDGSAAGSAHARDLLAAARPDRSARH